MNPQIANMTLQFLQRVTLQPNEIEAYQAVMTALQAIANPQAPRAVPPMPVAEDEPAAG